MFFHISYLVTLSLRNLQSLSLSPITTIASSAIASVVALPLTPALPPLASPCYPCFLFLVANTAPHHHFHLYIEIPYKLLPLPDLFYSNPISLC